MADVYESVLCVKNEVFVYRIPPRPSNRGYRASEWNLDTPDWTGRLRVVAKGKELFIKLEDKTSGELFAQCPVEAYPSIAVEPVMDSSRYFVIRIKDPSGRSAFIGIGFSDRSDSFDLNVSLQDHFNLPSGPPVAVHYEMLDARGKVDASRLGEVLSNSIVGADVGNQAGRFNKPRPPSDVNKKRLRAGFDTDHQERWIKQEDEASKATTELDKAPKLDLGFKEGQTITLNIGTKKGDASKPKPKKAVGGLLPPPPGPGGVKLPAPPTNQTFPSAPSAIHPTPAAQTSSGTKPSTFPSGGTSSVDLLLDLGSTNTSAPPLASVPLQSQNLPDLWGDFTGASTNNSAPPPSNNSAMDDWVQF